MRVIILSKAPVAGKVKTRLMSKYSANQAADIHQRMLETVVAKVCNSFEDVWLAVDDVEHICFKSLQSRFSFDLMLQGAGDLGDRLSRLMTVSFTQDSQSVMFLGTDSPHVDAQRYREAEAALHVSDIVVGPVEDGGYDLIALRKPVGQLFEGVHWGTDSVFDETMSVIHKLDLSFNVLNTSFDLDRPEDLERALPESW